MENKFSPQLIAKAKSAKTEAELLTLAKENGVELTEEQAKAYFEQLHKSGELSDEELDNVSGGGCYTTLGELWVTASYCCDYYKSVNAEKPDYNPIGEERNCGTCAKCSKTYGWSCGDPRNKRKR